MTSASPELKPVYLIVSAHALLVEQAVLRLKSRVGASGDLDYNMQVFNADSASPDAVVGACNTLPFGADRRLVIVDGIHKAGKPLLDALVRYCEDPSPSTVLALTGEKLAKNTRLYKLIDSAAGVVERKLERSELPRFIRQRCEDLDCRIDHAAVEALVEQIGPDLHRLTTELDKLVAYVESGAAIGEDDVSFVVSGDRPVTAWQFAEAVADRDCTRAMQRLAALMNEGETPYGLHALLVRTLRDLMAVRALLDRGLSDVRSISAALGRPDWQVKRMLRQARSFTGPELLGLLRDGVDTEQNMKTSRDSRLALEIWVVRFCTS